MSDVPSTPEQLASAGLAGAAVEDPSPRLCGHTFYQGERGMCVGCYLMLRFELDRRAFLAVLLEQTRRSKSMRESVQIALMSRGIRKAMGHS